MKVNDRFFEFDGLKYFRRKAMSVELGQIGKKRTKWIERDDSLNLRGEVIDDDSFSFQYLSQGGVDFGGELDLESIPVLSPTANANLKVAKENQATVSLIKLSIEQDDLIDAINRDARALRNMKAGPRMRAVNETFVIFAAELSESSEIDFDVAAEANLRGDGIDLRIEGSSGHTAKVKIEEGSTFAYLLARETPRSRRNRRVVTDLRTDAYGIA